MPLFFDPLLPGSSRTNPLSHLDASRRQWLKAAAGSMLGISASPWLPDLARVVAADPKRRRHCILLWMAGGPSQIDTFDMKPKHDNGGEFREIHTSVPGVRFSEHLPTLAMHADQLAVVRSLSTREGDHARGTQLMRTGKAPGGQVAYPSIGASLSKSLHASDRLLPEYVSIGALPVFGGGGFGPGFLGPRYAPTNVGIISRTETDARTESEESVVDLGVKYLSAAVDVDAAQLARRRQLWATMQQGFLDRHPTPNAIAHNTVYHRAMEMMDNKAGEAFDLAQEGEATRARYGPGLFGQGCLLARRLVERGVPVVEVILGGNDIGWDTHQGNFTRVKSLSQELDAGWGTLMGELAERDLLADTTLLWMGEFGRTPAINNNAGRDHFPAAWSCVFAGGGIAGGQVYGETTSDGMEVADNKVEVGGVLATLCKALGVDPDQENETQDGRPIKIAEGDAIEPLLS